MGAFYATDLDLVSPPRGITHLFFTASPLTSGR